MSKFVVDANVAIKWVLPEIHTQAALRLLQDESNILLVPDFFFSEVSNILWKQVRRGETTLEIAQQHLRSLIEVDFLVYPSQLSKKWVENPVLLGRLFKMFGYIF